MSLHPIISVYGETCKEKFPLILIIGREPNGPTGEKIDNNNIDNYDFDKYPHCAFWNISYSILSEITFNDKSMLKDKCRNMKSSPIIFANVLYETINTKESKQESRKRMLINTNELKRHIKQIFSNVLIERVKLIICSGISELDDIIRNNSNINEDSSPSKIIEFHIYDSNKDIQYCDVDYFCRWKRKRIFNTLKNKSLIIHDIIAKTEE